MHGAFRWDAMCIGQMAGTWDLVKYVSTVWRLLSHQINHVSLSPFHENMHVLRLLVWLSYGRSRY